MMEEIVIMQQFNHRNVLRLIGVVVEGLTGPSIVMPFMSNGNLSSFLRKNRETNVLPPTANEEDVSLSLSLPPSLPLSPLSLSLPPLPPSL